MAQRMVLDKIFQQGIFSVVEIMAFQVSIYYLCLLLFKTILFPGYIKYRKLCGLSGPSNWNDKPSDISQENWNNLKLVYNAVADIDAFTGGVSEESIPDGILGMDRVRMIGNHSIRTTYLNQRVTVGIFSGLSIITKFGLVGKLEYLLLLYCTVHVFIFDLN